jgi:hypothetical protein
MQEPSAEHFRSDYFSLDLIASTKFLLRVIRVLTRVRLGGTTCDDIEPSSESILGLEPSILPV